MNISEEQRFELLDIDDVIEFRAACLYYESVRKYENSSPWRMLDEETKAGWIAEATRRERGSEMSKRDAVALKIYNLVTGRTDYAIAGVEVVNRPKYFQAADYIIELAANERVEIGPAVYRLNEMLGCDKIINEVDWYRWADYVREAIALCQSLGGVTRSQTAEIRKQRAEVYGDARTCHKAIGEAWRGILRQSWQQDTVPPIDAHTVALMLAVFKCIRAATKSGHEDSYVDAISYVELAREFLSDGTMEGDSSK